MSRSTAHDPTEIRHEVVVPVGPDAAFEAFADLGRIKPAEHNLLAVPIRETVVERHPGGDVTDVGIDGSTCRWAQVTAYDPPTRLVLAWFIGSDWQLEADPANASEVEVRFDPEGPGTRVSLAHRHLERHGAAWRAVRDGVEGEAGWPLYLDRLSALVSRGQL